MINAELVENVMAGVDRYIVRVFVENAAEDAIAMIRDAGLPLLAEMLTARRG